MPECEGIELKLGRDLLSGYLQHFNSNDFQFLIEVNFPSLYQTNKDKRNGTGSISFGWSWFFCYDSNSRFQLNHSYNNKIAFDQNLKAYSKLMVSAYISGLDRYDQVYHRYYPKHYVQFDGIWIDFTFPITFECVGMPKYSDIIFPVGTPIMINPVVLRQHLTRENSSDTISVEEDEFDSTDDI